MVSIHCLRTHVLLWHSGKSACLVNRRSLVKIRFICQNEFHPLSTNSRGCCGLAVKCSCLVNRRSLVQIRAVPHFQIIVWFVIMLTRLICQNDFHLLSMNSRGAAAQRLKRYVQQAEEIPGSNPGCASFSNHTLVCNYVCQVYLSK